MPYYIRVLSTSANSVSLSDLQSAIERDNLRAMLPLEEDADVAYFPRVRCIYAFQVLSGSDYKNSWEILDAVKNHIWSAAPSILQADNEGGPGGTLLLGSSGDC